MARIPPRKISLFSFANSDLLARHIKDYIYFFSNVRGKNSPVKEEEEERKQIDSNLIAGACKGDNGI